MLDTVCFGKVLCLVDPPNHPVLLSIQTFWLNILRHCSRHQKLMCLGSYCTPLPSLCISFGRLQVPLVSVQNAKGLDKASVFDAL